jgi:hypothetical protein
MDQRKGIQMKNIAVLFLLAAKAVLRGVILVVLSCQYGRRARSGTTQ